MHRYGWVIQNYTYLEKWIMHCKMRLRRTRLIYVVISLIKTGFRDDIKLTMHAYIMHIVNIYHRQTSFPASINQNHYVRKLVSDLYLVGSQLCILLQRLFSLLFSSHSGRCHLPTKPQIQTRNLTLSILTCTMVEDWKGHCAAPQSFYGVKEYIWSRASRIIMRSLWSEIVILPHICRGGLSSFTRMMPISPCPPPPPTFKVSTFIYFT